MVLNKLRLYLSKFTQNRNELHLQFSDEVGSRLDRRAKYTGLNSRFELVREAMVLYDWMCMAYQEGKGMKAFFGGDPMDVLEELKKGRKEGRIGNIINITDYLPTGRPNPPKPKDSA